MKITIGKEGLCKSHQDEFPEEIRCCRCEGTSRIAFVAHEGMDPEDNDQPLHRLHINRGKGDLWLHDSSCFAIYLCKDCLEPTALGNQA